MILDATSATSCQIYVTRVATTSRNRWRAQCCQFTNERGDVLIAHMVRNAFVRATTTIEHDLERMTATETMFNAGSEPWCSEMTMKHNTNQFTLLLRRSRGDRLGAPVRR